VFHDVEKSVIETGRSETALRSVTEFDERPPMSIIGRAEFETWMASSEHVMAASYASGEATMGIFFP